MAMTLREKMPASHPLIIQDVNHDAVKRFQEEVRSKGTGANSMKLQTADSAREVAERSVSFGHIVLMSFCLREYPCAGCPHYLPSIA